MSATSGFIKSHRDRHLSAWEFPADSFHALRLAFFVMPGKSLNEIPRDGRGVQNQFHAPRILPAPCGGRNDLPSSAMRTPFTWVFAEMEQAHMQP